MLWAWRLLRLDFTGIAFAALFFCLSLTPSLLPRDWLFAGLIGGINAAIGYGIGVFVVKMFRRFLIAGRGWRRPPPRVAATAKAATVIVAVGACVLMVIPAAASIRLCRDVPTMPWRVLLKLAPTPPRAATPSRSTENSP